jgi:hypothetical protein
MALAMRTGVAPRAGLAASRRVRQGCALRPHPQQRPLCSSGARRAKVAAIDTPATYDPEQPDNSATASGAVDPELQQQLAVQQLDEAQEDLLKWMLFLDSDAQEADLDAMVDQEDVGDEEFEDLYDDVEGMLDESGASFKVGDKVYGTVYEVDEDGAYVEIGAKTAGFVPLSECSLGRLKTVSGTGWHGGRGPANGAVALRPQGRGGSSALLPLLLLLLLLLAPRRGRPTPLQPPGSHAPATPRAARWFHECGCCCSSTRRARHVPADTRFRCDSPRNADWARVLPPTLPSLPSPLPQPLEVLRPGMKREFVVVEDEDEYEEVILSLAAMEVGAFWGGGDRGGAGNAWRARAIVARTAAGGCGA